MTSPHHVQIASSPAPLVLVSVTTTALGRLPIRLERWITYRYTNAHNATVSIGIVPVNAASIHATSA